MDISHVFNVEDLLPYRDIFEPYALPSSVFGGETSKGAPIMPSLQYSKEMMDIIFDNEFVTSRDGDFRHFLVKWFGCLDFDATWMKDDICHLDHSLLDYYLSSHSSESSSFQHGGMIGHEVGPYLGLDKIGIPSPMIFFIIISYFFNRIFWICLLGVSIGAYK